MMFIGRVWIRFCVVNRLVNLGFWCVGKLGWYVGLVGKLDQEVSISRLELGIGRVLWSLVFTVSMDSEWDEGYN